MEVTGRFGVRFGVRFGWATLFAVTAFVGCGGSSQTHGESGDDGERGGTSGATSRGGSGGSVGAAPGSGGVGRGGSSRGGSGAATADPPPGPQFCAGVPCDAPLACCMTTGECFDPRTDADACARPEPDRLALPRRGRSRNLRSASAGARFACRTTADCGDGEYCQGEGCDARGGCVPFGHGNDCGVVIDPVCGCNGTSYTSADCAASRGVRVAHEGECTADGGRSK